MSTLPRRNGLVRYGLQAVPLRLSGSGSMSRLFLALNASFQICRFCWHHIKENLNGRCPACRREYTEEAVQFKAVNPEEYVLVPFVPCND